MTVAVSFRAIYRANVPYDEERPEFDCYNPAYSGDFYMVDCWPCTDSGEIHPGYNVCAVPVHTSNLGEIVGAASAGAFWDEQEDD